MKHAWQVMEGGKVDEFAHEVETETRGHNGPRCTVCEFFFCMWCYREGWDRECPGPAPDGAKWDWIDEGMGKPAEVPELWWLRKTPGGDEGAAA